MAKYAIQGQPVKWRAHDADPASVRRGAHVRAIVAGGEPPETTIEKIVGGDNNLKPIAFLERGLAVAKAVAHITLADGGMATGFLIAPDVLLTNRHVFTSKDDARHATVRFNFQADLTGNMLPTTAFTCDPDSLFETSPEDELDYAVVRMKGDPGLTFGFLRLRNHALEVEDKVNIIQHPGGQPKQIAMNDNEVKFVDERIAQYITDTLPGSSGSPVFDDNWRVVALHHSGGNIPEPGSGAVHFRNEGIRIGAIVQHLPPLG